MGRERSPGQDDADASGLDDDDEGSRTDPCHVIWVDPRAFKDDSEKLRLELQASANGVAVKAHKTAEKCMRLLRKKRASRERSQQVRPVAIYLVSWANAPTLVP